MKILLLAGTGEARELASILTGRGHRVIVSLAGLTRQHAEPPCETRIGGFGGDAGFVSWLDRHAPDLVIDATHPFADRITRRTARICRETGIACLHVLRPPWSAGPDDDWHFIDAPAEAARHIPRGQRIFLATGRQTLEQFAGLAGRQIYCRRIDPPNAPFPFPSGAYIVGRPPFSVEEEVRLFARLDIDWLVVKNAGGDASRSKLDAARVLRIPVLLLNRPPEICVPSVETVDAAMTWIDAHADH